LRKNSINSPKIFLDMMLNNNNKNNQAFYFQASWNRLEMKLHEPKKEKIKGDKKTKSKKEKRQ
jgi:hypothetical protein